MKASLKPLLNNLPTDVRFIKAIAHGSMSVELYAPKLSDPQKPHDQDELYFVQSGEADFYLAGTTEKCQTGDCLFVPAGAEHRFLNFTSDFVTWVVFWGPKGGERNS
ncbi:MAG: cupin domain-containing protein [Cytophagales bacterium]|nr:cupin domain-containing protein [Cytophagales bacterium]